MELVACGNFNSTFFMIEQLKSEGFTILVKYDKINIDKKRRNTLWKNLDYYLEN